MQIAGQYFYAAAQGADYTGGSAMFTVGLSTLIFLAGNVFRAITLLLVSIFIFAQCSHKCQQRSDSVLPLDPSRFNSNFCYCWVVLCAYGYAVTHEVFFGIFEYLPIIFIITLWAARPLCKFLPLDLLGCNEDGETEVERMAELNRNASINEAVSETDDDKKV
ncbi:hypothetical protein I305_04658 [Cryptococcus gattii E566]|uniref:Uncharacterized protein n=2 Tax=Cryptococcus gattii TaxID=37769 RepID=E6RF94_CRYGW|nr:Hypothetical Protein CGB_M1600W [Cryptococcus gattii WM276]ADV25476.1 Hypothetical Protein CGB_M1600W [Cryptococcus gattii WM276]KIR78907.1 hypothetical protein I306_04117 [Cryptococcus gattii EJB2]KIY32905.1 hypothetical protein I305_04658 [Cryptococcus gattii E566]KJE05031.1 hypothetical protein I311_01124 [Cryptococcus gattii NT-10]